MINYIYGRSGSGKTTLVLEKAAKLLKEGKRVFVLVPEQMMLETEKSFTAYAEKERIPTLRLEIVSFRRLANRVFRSLGGLSYNYIGRGGRTLVMWHALCECADVLKKYNNLTLADRGTLSLMLSAIDEFKNCAVTPDALADAADKLEQDGQTSLAEKIRDISLIYSVFTYLLKEQYDDPADDLVRLSNILSDSDFFSGCNLFCDSFYGYTQIEICILEQIMLQCDSFTVTLPIFPGDSAPFCDTVRNTEKKLIGIEKKHRLLRGETIVLDDGVRFKNSDLKYLETNLWNYSEKQYCGDCSDNIKLLECEDAYGEAEAVAASIISKVRDHGGSFSDHVIILRDVAAWRGIVDAVLEKNGIPYFMSVRTELTSKPLVRLIVSALSCIGGGWRCDDVMTLIKTGLAGLSPDECNLIENYATSWRINGKQWYSEDEWMMNPDGYTGILTDRGAKILAKVNYLRRCITSPLALIPSSRSTVREYAEGIYNYMVTLGIDKILEKTGEDEPIQVFDAVIEALDTLVTVAGGTDTTPSDFAKLFLISIEESDIGRIPTGTDVVTVGSSTLLRTANCRHAYIMGVNEGQFPAAVSDDGLFCDNDRIALETVGIELSGKTDTRVSDELLYFYRAVTAASDSVTVSCSSQSKSGTALKPSMGWERIRTLFPSVEVTRYIELPPENTVQTKQTALEYIVSAPSSSASKALKHILSSDDEYALRIASMSEPIIAGREYVSSENIPAIYNRKVMLSSSSIESYAKCAFAYFCKYFLNLKSSSAISFGGADVGNYMHSILEELASAIRDGRLDTEQSDSRELEKFIDLACVKYKERLFGKNSKRNARNEHLFRRLRRTVVLLAHNFIDEFNASAFRPTCFELPISFGEGAVSPSAVELPGGGHAYLSGRIDRVDTYRRDGELYVRVIDYKTGKNRFSEEEIELGLNIQLPLYLFSLCDADHKNIDILGGEKGDKVVPAAAFYLSARTPEVREDAVDNNDDILRSADMSLSRNGILLSEDEIIEAMDSSHSGRFIPVRYKKGGGFSYRQNGLPLTRDGFDELRERLNSTVCEIAEGIRKGVASARPLKCKSIDACEYCQLKPICRITEKHR